MIVRIPFNKPSIVGNELDYISQAVLGGHLAGDGKFTALCNEWLERRLGAGRVLLTTSCTHALEMAALLCDIQPGDEVILPSYTFVSTANAFVLRGAKPVFVDIREDTLNIDESSIEEAVSDRTKVVVPVHYAGVSCEMDTIMDVARRHGLMVVEDAAQAVDARYKGRFLGTIGDIGTLSFHETKNFTSGEGGAIVLNDEQLIERAEILREKGTNRSQFFRGEIDRYTWVDHGSSYLPSEVVAAFLYAQLEEVNAITRRRHAIYDYYSQKLAPLEERGMVRLPYCPAEAEHNAHMYYLIVDDVDTRTRLIASLREVGIHAVFHYVPLHSSPMGQRFGYRDGDLPNTERISQRLVRLPFYYSLTRGEQDEVVRQIERFFRPNR
jgi:dTDP-4-amino-4,6-dideoxygalactose transaminase